MFVGGLKLIHSYPSNPFQIFSASLLEITKVIEVLF